ncbi:MAG: dTDP-4-amino-4,6-dideoxygalactose transaminase [Luteibaculum sp.]
MENLEFKPDHRRGTIPLSKPAYTGKEMEYVAQAIHSGQTGGNGPFTRACQQWFKEHFGFDHCLLTSSCTDALEMAALLFDIKEGDEVIVADYNFTSAANAFLLRGANVVFAPSRIDHPGMDEAAISDLITPQTKAIVVMHYAGVACDMDQIMAIAERHQLKVVEDAAHCMDAFYKGQRLGTFGHLSAFSFHETKNISCGEGGMLLINDPQLLDRAEILWQMGTNRSAYQRGESKDYSWKGIGSSYLMSDVNAAILLAQLESLEEIQKERLQLWTNYYRELRALESPLLKLPIIPGYATHNAHNFYVLLATRSLRDKLMKSLGSLEITASPHFRSLDMDHKLQHGLLSLVPIKNQPQYPERILRLPLFPGLETKVQQRVIAAIKSFIKEFED